MRINGKNPFNFFEAFLSKYFWAVMGLKNKIKLLQTTLAF